MSKRPEEDEDDYHESEDEDYNPDVEAAKDATDSDTEKADESYVELQGTGGLVKTRAQRRAEAEAAARGQKPPHSKDAVVVGTAGVDIDALWSEMNSAPSTGRPAARPAAEAVPAPAVASVAAAAAPAPQRNGEPVKQSSAEGAPSEGAPSEAKRGAGAPQEEYVTIKRTFKFAGEVRTEEKRVLKSSAEGQDHLRAQKAAAEAAAEAPRLRSQGRGPVKRKMSLMEEYQMNKTKKINTLEKSRLDWLGFVDKEGIREDLTKHNKSGYLDKQDFLSRADLKAEQELRQQRLKRMQQN